MRDGDLTIAELAAYMTYLPPGSAVWAKEHGLPFGWSLTDVLISDLYAAWAGEPHPARTAAESDTRASSAKSKVAALKAQRARLGT